MATEIVSGPEILLRDDLEETCRFCALELPRTQEGLLAHYTSVHKYPVTANYTYKGVRYVELDKDGQCSDRAKRLKNRAQLTEPRLRIEKLREDFANDGVVYGAVVEGEAIHVFDVRISATADTMSSPHTVDRIREWFLNNPLPPHGASVEIPGYHFDPRYI